MEVQSNCWAQLKWNEKKMTLEWKFYNRVSTSDFLSWFNGSECEVGFLLSSYSLSSVSRSTVGEEDKLSQVVPLSSHIFSDTFVPTFIHVQTHLKTQNNCNFFKENKSSDSYGFHTCNLSTQEIEAGEFSTLGLPGLNSENLSQTSPQN